MWFHAAGSSTQLCGSLCTKQLVPIAVWGRAWLQAPFRNAAIEPEHALFGVASAPGTATRAACRMPLTVAGCVMALGAL